MNSFSDKLKELRKQSGLSVPDVLERLRIYGIEVGDKALYHWEAGRRQPDADTFIALCKIYNVKSFDVFRDETEKTPAPEGARDVKTVVPMELSTRALVAMGLIHEGEQLSDADIAFLEHIVGLLRAWFAKHKAKNG